MDHKVFYIGIKWAKEHLRAPESVRAAQVERSLDPLGDWIRFDSHTWFLSAECSAEEIYNGIRRILASIRPFDDLLLVIKLDPNERFGWAPQWIWDWLDGQRQDPPRKAVEIIGELSSKGQHYASVIEETADG
jgi:hypothetical protein